MPAQDDIIISRSDAVEQLSDAELELLRRSPEMQASLQENRALAELSRCQPAAPQREALLQAAYGRAGRTNTEDRMNPFSRLLGGRPWYVQAAAAIALVAGLIALATLLPPQQKSYAQEGYMLSYDLGQAPMPEGHDGNKLLEDPRIAKVQEAVKAFADERKAAAAKEGRELKNQVMISVNNNNGHLTAAVALRDADEELLKQLQDRIAKAVPELPVPSVVDATWFSHEGGANGDGLSLMIDDHAFNFGPGFSQDEVVKTINDWLAVNKPGHKAEVVVQKSTGPDGEQRVEVRLEIKGEDEDGAKDGEAGAEK